MDHSLIEVAAAHLAVQGTYLRGGSIRCRDGFLPQFAHRELSLTPQYRGGPQGTFEILTVSEDGRDPSYRLAVFGFEAGVRLVDDGDLDPDHEIDDASIHLEIAAEFVAHYLLRDGLTEENLRPALEEFARYNVGYHVWPYWREYVQSTCARVGIPPIPIPFYQIQNDDPVETATTD